MFRQLETAINTSGAYTETLDLSPVDDELLWEKDDAQFLGLGTFMDFDMWFLGAEYTLIDSDPNLGVHELTSYYAMAGVRLSAWTLSLTYAVDEDEASTDAYDTYRDLTDPFLWRSWWCV